MYESLPISNVSKYDQGMCLEFTDKLPVSGDTLIAVFNKPLMRKVKCILIYTYYKIY